MPRLQRIPVRAATTYVWLPCLLAALILYTRDGLAYPAPTGFATVWVAHACMLACLALSWDETTGYRGRAFWARPALCVAAVFGTGLSVGLEPLRCLALGLANLATALVAFWVYRFRGLGRSWAVSYTHLDVYKRQAVDVGADDEPVAVDGPEHPRDRRGREHEAAADGVHVEGGGVAGLDVVLHVGGGRRLRVVRRGGRDHDVAQVVGGEPGRLQGPYGGARGQVGGGLVVADPAALTDGGLCLLYTSRCV